MEMSPPREVISVSNLAPSFPIVFRLLDQQNRWHVNVSVGIISWSCQRNHLSCTYKVTSGFTSLNHYAEHEDVILYESNPCIAESSCYLTNFSGLCKDMNNCNRTPPYCPASPLILPARLSATQLQACRRFTKIKPTNRRWLRRDLALPSEGCHAAMLRRPYCSRQHRCVPTRLEVVILKVVDESSSVLPCPLLAHQTLHTKMLFSSRTCSQTQSFNTCPAVGSP